MAQLALREQRLTDDLDCSVTTFRATAREDDVLRVKHAESVGCFRERVGEQNGSAGAGVS